MNRLTTRLAICFAASFSSTPLVFAQNAPATIEWHVVNRFPLFERAADFQRLEQAWQEKGSAQATVDSPGFTKSLRDLIPIRTTAWRPRSGTYDKSTLFPATHTVAAQAFASPSNATCRWMLNEREIANLDCSQIVEVRVSSGQAFSLRVESTGGYVGEVNNARIEERLVVALGDSFASGEGNPDHPAEFRAVTPSVNWPFEKTAGRHVLRSAAWWDEACHRSLLSWPALAALGQAVSNRRSVVQFASFACSGAEIYDGLLRAQISPPGWDRSNLQRDMYKRHGGPGYRWTGERYEQPQCAGADCRSLRLSQLGALADLVCPTGGVAQDEVTHASPVEGYNWRQTLYGAVNLPRCSNPRKIDQLLISIGGNDVGFAGIVRWLITPPNGKNAFNTFFLDISRQIGGVVEPSSARKSIDHLETLYAHLGEALSRLGVSPYNVALLEYPDPTLGQVNFQKCNARTRDGNAPFQAMVNHQIGNPNFLFGINRKEFDAVRPQFIEPLQRAQRAGLPKGWTLIKSQQAFNDAKGNPSGFCAVSSECTASSCPNGEKTRWWTSMHYAAEPRITRLSEYDAYDSMRSRGMRYAMDALLTSAAKQKENGPLHRNWLTSTAHPTGNVHARIADLINKTVTPPPTK